LKNDRFLIGILIGIAIIVLFSVGIVLFNHNELTYQPEDTPEGVVNNYLTAWTLEDYEKVADYLYEADNKPEFQMIIKSAYESKYSVDTTSIRIEKSIIQGDEATVVVTLIQQPGDPFSTSTQSSDLVTFIKQDGAWKIKQFPYPYWGWDWYQLPVDVQK
jgi:hypothetical protein